MKLGYKELLSPYFDQIKEWSEQKMGTREIAKKLGVHRNTVKKACKLLGLDISKNRNSIKPIPKEKICTRCGETKKIEEMARYKSPRGRQYKYLNSCIVCEAEKNKIKRKKLYLKNKDKEKKYHQEHKKETQKRVKYRMHNDINFRLRCQISSNINHKLRARKLSKNGNSCIKFLPYTIDELKTHLEQLFEPWMNWDNWGHYRLNKWDDNDLTTWKWNIDHIIPASKFTYNSVYDEGFQKCWSLNNLRPLSAKINVCERDRR